MFATRRLWWAIAATVVALVIVIVIAARGRFVSSSSSSSSLNAAPPRPQPAAPAPTPPLPPTPTQSPTSARAAAEASVRPDDVAYWTCAMHPDVRMHAPGKCPTCGMTLDPVLRKDAAPPLPGKSASLSNEQAGAGAAPEPPPDASASAGLPARGEVAIDTRRQQLIGVRTVRVERTSLSRPLRAAGLVRYDETRQADVNLKVEGWIRSLHVNYTGRFVRQGEPLFTIYSPDLLSTQQEYALALKSREQARHSQLADTRVYADRLVDAARQRLLRWDLPADQIQALEQGRRPEATALFRSPVSGVVIDKRAVEGMHVSPGDSLYRIADLSIVWVEADVYEQELTAVRRGAAAIVTIDAYPDARFRGRVTYISPAVEEKTRTVKVRVELPNRDGRLKPGMFANVELASPARNGLAVPRDAVLDSGADRVVFVAQGDGYFVPRRVTLGDRLGDTIEIRGGLQEGDVVATGAAFFLDSESQIRASLQGYEAPPATAGPATAGPAAETTAGRERARLQIAFRSQPDPPRAGENQFEVMVTEPDGRPVTDAAVTVTFYMAAMPTMNMPAMRNEAKLLSAGNGLYRGTGDVMMAGRWDVSVLVTRNGQRIGAKQITVVAR